MLKRDVELMYELGSLRFIERAWKQFLSPNFSNLAEHHLRVIWIALLLSKMEKKGDTSKIVKMALVHDVGESRAGDVHYISRQYTKRDEHKAILDIFKNTSLSEEMVSLWDEYEARKSIEAKIVKDADFLDVDFELQEQKAKGEEFIKVWSSNRKIIYELFYTRSAKKLWKAIKKSNPTDWFNHARNRFVEGDLKKQMLKLKKKNKLKH